VGGLKGRLERLEEHLRQRNAGHISEASRAREGLSRKLWVQMLNTAARIRRSPIDPEPVRYEVGKLRDESPISIACHVIALAGLGHEDEEEARRVLAEVIEDRAIDGAPLWEMVEGMTAALDRMAENS